MVFRGDVDKRIKRAAGTRAISEDVSKDVTMILIQLIMWLKELTQGIFLDAMRNAGTFHVH